MFNARFAFEFHPLHEQNDILRASAVLATNNKGCDKYKYFFHQFWIEWNLGFVLENSELRTIYE